MRLSTGQVADLLRVQRHRIDYVTRQHRIRPLKTGTGAFEWTLQEVQDLAALLGASAPKRKHWPRTVERTEPACHSQVAVESTKDGAVQDVCE